MDDTSSIDTLIKSFAKAVFGGPQDLQAQLAAQAEANLPLIRDARQFGDLDAKASNAPHLFTWLMGAFDAGETAEKLQAFSRDDVAGLVKTFLSQRPQKKDQLLAIATEIKQTTLAMDETDHITYARALDAGLPPSLQTATREARNGISLEEEVRETRLLAAALPKEAIAEALARRDADVSEDRLVDGMMNFLQQGTPDRLAAMHSHVSENFEPATVGLLLKRGWEAIEEVLEAAARGNFLRPERPKKVQAFGRTLQETYAVLEEGFAAADISVPPVFRDFVVEYMDTTRLLRRAQEIALIDTAKYGITEGITVTRPLRLKTPKP